MSTMTLERPRRPLLTLSGVRQRPIPPREDYSETSPVAATAPELIKMPAEPPIRSIPAKPAPAPRPDSSPPVLPVPTSKPKSVAKSIHVPADAETIAANQRLEAEWHARQNGPKMVEMRLRELCPNSFNDNIVPLKIGIHRDINELLGKEFEQDIIGRFLRKWTRRKRYWGIVSKGQMVARFDLDGQPV